MKRFLVATALLAMVASGLVAPPARAVHPRGDGGMVKAIVVLRSQVDPGTVRAPSRRLRQVAMVRALRARAAADQTGVRALLRTRRAQGLVARTVPLWVVNAVAVVARPSVIAELAARPEVREIDPDRTVQAPPALGPASVTTVAVEPNVGAVNAPALWDLGYAGQGTVVATMDTGVDAGHPDLAASWRGGSNSWYDPNGEHPTTPTDVSGHGTSTMGVIVGGSAGGTAIGVAPGAKWIAVKIFSDRGTSTTSRIHQGFQWLLDPDGNPATADGPDVLNDSWTGAVGGCDLEFQPDLRNLRAAGILPVFSAGNYGPTGQTVLSPANLPEALAVGSIDDAGVVATSSSRGPSACGQPVMPRLVAPGVGVRTTDLYGGYVDASGTSLAAPHVAGTLALLLSAFPELSADRQQAALESTAVDLGPAGADDAYGYGRIDALAAYAFLDSAPDFDLAAPASQASTAAGGTVTYSVSVTPANGFTGDVSLALTGLTTDQASWAISPAVLAGGSGTAEVTVTTATTLAPGTYPLTITGTAGSLTRSASVSLLVTDPPGFGLGVSPPSLTAVAGSSVAYTASVSALNGFAGAVSMSLSGLPAAVGSASFAPSVVAGAGTTTLTIATAASAPPGTYPLTVTGTSEGTSHSSPVTLVVTPRPDFSLTASPAFVSVLRRQSATYTVSTAAVGGLAGTVALSVSGAPARTTVGFTANPVAVSGSSTLRVTTTSLTPRGTYTLRITGNSGSLVHEATVTLVVR